MGKKSKIAELVNCGNGTYKPIDSKEAPREGYVVGRPVNASLRELNENPAKYSEHFLSTLPDGYVLGNVDQKAGDGYWPRVPLYFVRYK